MTLKWNEVEEQTRTYLFSNKATVTLRNIVRIAVSDTTHRLESKDGSKYIIPNGWIAIKIDAKKWSL